jgi:hypothetical protein
MKIYGDWDHQGGEYQNAKAHVYATLPAYNASDDPGRIIYVSAGTDQGFWLGNGNGLGTWVKQTFGSNTTSWALTNQTIADGVTNQATLTSSLTPYPVDGIILKMVLSSTLSSGFVTVALYNDTGRADKIYECVFDLGSSLLTDHIPVGFFLDNTDGQIYVDITNSTGSSGDFTLTLTGTGITQVPSSAPPGSGSGIDSDTAGDGIAYDIVNLWLEIDLDTNPGLELNGASGVSKLRAKVDAAGGISRTAAGLACDTTVVRTTGNQSITGAKDFAALAMTQSAISGPPIAGAHVKGEFNMDANMDIWMCVTAGTPGTWTFWGWKEQNFGGNTDGSSYTGTATAGNTVDLALTATGRRGVIRKGVFWACAPAYAATDIDAPFRVECYPNENYLGQEMLWTLTMQARTSYITGAEVAPQTVLSVNSVGSVALDDLVRVRRMLATVAEEYGRIITRTPAGPSFTLDEVTINDYAANDPVMMCSEALEMYWKNNSGVPANHHKIYLRFYNDHPTQDLIFGYHLYVENIGGGVPI